VARRRILLTLGACTGWALAAVAALAACGEQEASAPAQTSSRASIVLAIRYDDGAGRVHSGRLRCAAGAQRASGVLAGSVPAARLCARTRAIAPLLTRRPPARRVCTQIYGGPETLQVTGEIDGRTVDRRFARTNGCEIADFARVARALAIRR